MILVRHGLSTDDLDKRYSGWNDCHLSEEGYRQMREIGRQLRQEHLSFDICFTSFLKRATQSLFVLQEEMDLLWVPVCSTWRLNDRMLGNLTGFHRDRAAALFGQNQLKLWLMQLDTAPPPLEETNASHPRLHSKYQSNRSIVPSTETLMDLHQRLKPFFFDEILANIHQGRSVLIVSHADIIKALLRLLKDLPMDQYLQHEIPIVSPIIVEFQWRQKKVIRASYLSQSPSANENAEPVFPLDIVS